MATIPLTDVPGPYENEDVALTAQMSTLTFTATEVAGNTVDISGLVLVAFNNTDVGAGTVTVPSTKDPFGRLAPITAFSIAAGATAYRFFSPEGWEDSAGSGTLTFTTSAVTIEAAAVRFGN